MSTQSANTTQQLEFETLVVDNDFEIARNHYPYIIRRRSNHRVIKEWNNGDGYKRITLNRKKYYVHVIVAKQFLHNDDPSHKTQVDHINHDRSDNRLENLRWCTMSENQRNKTSYAKNKFEYREELGDDAFEVTFYNGHEFENLWFDPEANCFYIYTGAAYREVHYHTTKAGALYIIMFDVQHVQACITLNKFKKSLEDDDSDED